MPSLKAIRKRISSVKSTQKITRAMKMVAGARLARAQARIVALRPYATKTRDVLSSVVAEYLHPEPVTGQEGAFSEPPDHPLLAERPEQNIALVVLTSDRGLCGAFNSNINKTAERVWRERTLSGQNVRIYTVGRKGREYLRRRSAPVVHDFTGIWEALDIGKARRIVRTVLAPFMAGEVDAIYLIYNEFKSAMSQRIVVEPLLPVRHPLESEGARLGEPARSRASDGSAALVGPASTGPGPVGLLYEPNKKALLERLVPMYVEVSILRALFESMASELGARMTAMDSATKNAKEMIDRLTLAYNRARQAAITKELMEIIGGAEALKG
jgi:F-type H+-transporting ATPase subunit gamma